MKTDLSQELMQLVQCFHVPGVHKSGVCHFKAIENALLEKEQHVIDGDSTVVLQVDGRTNWIGLGRSIEHLMVLITNKQVYLSVNAQGFDYVDEEIQITGSSL